MDTVLNVRRAATDFLLINIARVSCASVRHELEVHTVFNVQLSHPSVRHPYGGFEISQPGARQDFDMYNPTQDIRENDDFKTA